MTNGQVGLGCATRWVVGRLVVLARRGGLRGRSGWIRGAGGARWRGCGGRRRRRGAWPGPSYKRWTGRRSPSDYRLGGSAASAAGEDGEVAAVVVARGVAGRRGEDGGFVRERVIW